MKLKGLEEKTYSYLQTPVYKGVLPNGLTVSLLVKPEFHETYGMLTTRFGAVDTIFRTQQRGPFNTYPAGIAHFLEHKLFEMDGGKDALQEFSRLGSDVNAYTNLHQTSYLFSTTDEVLPALELLQDLVGQAFFTEESVEREKAIIAQEIEMYQDDPDTRLYTEILASLYPQTPLACDIAGSVESIQAITAEELYENFEAFYQPQNMSLFLVGNFELMSVWEQLQQKQSSQKTSSLVVESQEIVHHPILENRTSNMEVASPKLAIGLRGHQKVDRSSLFRYRLCLSLLFSMLFGWTSKRHQELYETGKIDASLSLHLQVRPAYHFFVLTVDTKEPIALSNLLRRTIKTAVTDPDVSEEHLELVKKETYGSFIRSLDSLEFTASNVMQYQLGEEDIFDLPTLLHTITLSEVLEVGEQFISNCDMTDFIIFPK